MDTTVGLLTTLPAVTTGVIIGFERYWFTWSAGIPLITVWFVVRTTVFPFWNPTVVDGGVTVTVGWVPPEENWVVVWFTVAITGNVEAVFDTTTGETEGVTTIGDTELLTIVGMEGFVTTIGGIELLAPVGVVEG